MLTHQGPFSANATALSALQRPKQRLSAAHISLTNATSLFAAAGPLPAPPAPQRRGTSPTAAALPPQERAAAARRDRQARVEHAQQQGRLGLDLGLMLGRSTRAGWGPGGLLASVGKLAPMQVWCPCSPTTAQQTANRVMLASIGVIVQGSGWGSWL